MRLVPVIPFFVANLVPAMVGVRFGAFLLTTFFDHARCGRVHLDWCGAAELFDGAKIRTCRCCGAHVIGLILGLCVLAALPIVFALARQKGYCSVTEIRTDLLVIAQARAGCPWPPGPARWARKARWKATRWG